MPNSAQGASLFQAILPLLIIFLIFYFLLILPQQRKEKQRREMLDNMKKGDRVITVGGIIATVEEIKGKIVTLKVADNVKVDFVKSSIAQIYQEQK
ncbi:MAG: preprotein translocase subunit YajC [Candidatus Omnitrophica bacterium]|nr:preprotein translocase subunit YajC [Candidatus Omnitrophota bacterium]MCM8828635.1 preprotein translocase subunit YajC [Candidatus Omnitrophota bacterium]